MKTSYCSPCLSEDCVTQIALSIVKENLHGLTFGQASRVLREAEKIIGATMVVDCTSEEFQKADEVFRAVAPEST
ncbi:hypothetical protein ACO026_003482 [Salmonella enterica subsp. enterica serovar Enteritidis]|nr:hypothetical protein [Salmonella enterica]EBF8755968.1 hypothetical protein [Salmonella enterica subsp. enterica serovar Enteritidis]EDY4476597.1 hypothetical protein [Salmonella enterica]EKQ3071339.1 hypothetical protein [Salmonella enterica]